MQRLRGDELGVAIDERFRSAPVDAHQHQIVLRAPFVVQSHKLVGEAVNEHFGPGALGAPVRSHVTQEVGSEVLEVALRVDLDRDVRPRDAIGFAFSHGHSKRAGLPRTVTAGRKAPRDLFTRCVLRCRKTPRVLYLLQKQHATAGDLPTVERRRYGTAGVLPTAERHATAGDLPKGMLY